MSTSRKKASSPVTLPLLRAKADIYAARLGAFYDGQKYFVPNSEPRYIGRTEEAFQRYLRGQGLSARRPEGCEVSFLECVCEALIEHHDVAFAGSLAGYQAGLHKVAGKRVLILDSPTIIEPREGNWDTLRKFLENLFGDQLPYVHALHKCAYESLREQRIIPYPACAVVGPPNCGKTFYHLHVKTPLLGGRPGHPYAFMMGSTDFNSDLFGSEVLMIDDEVEPHDLRGRRRLQALIKQYVAAETHRCHPKGKAAISLPVLWFISIAANPQNIGVLHLDSTTRDKLCLFKGHEPAEPLPSITSPAAAQLLEAITTDLPAYADFLLKHEIPEQIKGGRFGVQLWQHPELLAALGELSGEIQLLTIIDGTPALFPLGKGGKAQPWEGNATELRNAICSRDAPLSYLALKLLSGDASAVWTGRFLAALVEQKSPRVSELPRRGNTRRWRITAP